MREVRRGWSLHRARQRVPLWRCLLRAKCANAASVPNERLLVREEATRSDRRKRVLRLAVVLFLVVMLVVPLAGGLFGAFIG